MKKLLTVSMAALSVAVLANQAVAGTAIASKATQDNQLNTTDSSKPVFSKNGKVTLILKSNATTGYSWSLDKPNSDSDIKVVSHKYIAPTSGLMGASGYEKWTFQLPKSMLKHPTKAKISMDYSRPWIKGSGSATVFTVRSGLEKSK